MVQAPDRPAEAEAGPSGQHSRPQPGRARRQAQILDLEVGN